MSAPAKKVFIVGACRTPIGNLNGSLSSLPAAKLGTTAIKGALERAKISPEKVSEVIMGQALTAGQGQNPSRQASMDAGLPKEVPAISINMLCGSGMRRFINQRPFKYISRFSMYCLILQYKRNMLIGFNIGCI